MSRRVDFETVLKDKFFYFKSEEGDVAVTPRYIGALIRSQRIFGKVFIIILPLMGRLESMFAEVQVKSYALNAVSDRGLTRTISANRRNVLPLAGEVIRIQKYPCLFAAWFKKRTIWRYGKRNFQIPANRFGGYLPNRISEPSDTRFSSDAVIHGFNDFMTQCGHSSVIRIPASPLKRIRDEPPG